jgi:palmitoyltransferase
MRRRRALITVDVVARDLSWPVTLLLLPLYILVPANMYVQYYLVTHINGGFPGATSAKELRWITPNPGGILAPERWGFHRRGKGTVSPRMPKAVRRCRKCNGPKPERAHHCSVCNRCVLLMDHHCPWIDACVGLHNQRHFVLFMLWLSFGATIFAILGYPHFWPSIDIYGSEVSREQTGVR